MNIADFPTLCKEDVENVVRNVWVEVDEVIGEVVRMNAPANRIGFRKERRANYARWCLIVLSFEQRQQCFCKEPRKGGKHAI